MSSCYSPRQHRTRLSGTRSSRRPPRAGGSGPRFRLHQARSHHFRSTVDFIFQLFHRVLARGPATMLVERGRHPPDLEARVRHAPTRGQRDFVSHSQLSRAATTCCADHERMRIAESDGRLGHAELAIDAGATALEPSQEPVLRHRTGVGLVDTESDPGPNATDDLQIRILAAADGQTSALGCDVVTTFTGQLSRAVPDTLADSAATVAGGARQHRRVRTRHPCGATCRCGQ
jgi:hypothetical protein